MESSKRGRKRAKFDLLGGELKFHVYGFRLPVVPKMEEGISGTGAVKNSK